MRKAGSYKSFLFSSVIGLLFISACTWLDADMQAFGQDLTLQFSTVSDGMGGRGGGAATTTEYFSKNALKTTSSDGTDSIIRLDTQKIISVDNKKKTYSEITFAQLQELMNKAGDALKGMSGEQMAAMKKMMGSTATTFDLKKVGPGENLAGYPTEKFVMSGPMSGEIWAAPGLKIPTAYYDAMKLQMPANPMFDTRKMVDEMKKLSGYPLKTITIIKIMNMETKSTKTVTSIQKGTIPASVFEPPAGYKKVAPSLQ